MRILIVIINYKTPQLICEALESLSGQLDLERDAVIVVDNDSQDSSVEKINDFIQSNAWQEWVTIKPSGINGGFSAGNNFGIKFAEAEYYLLLNSDAYVREDAIESLISTAESTPSLGIVAPRLEWPDGVQQVSCFYDLTPLNSFLHAAKTGLFTTLFKLFGIYEIAIPLEQHETVQPEWLSFACVLLRGAMIKEIGLMDENYFMYREDNDYCRRATNAGWGLKFEPDARVVHLNQGASNQTVVKQLPVYYFKSRSYYFIKYYGRTGLFIANVMWSFGRCFSVLREVLQSKPKAFHNMMWKDIWIGFLGGK